MAAIMLLCGPRQTSIRVSFEMKCWIGGRNHEGSHKAKTDR